MRALLTLRLTDTGSPAITQVGPFINPTKKAFNMPVLQNLTVAHPAPFENSFSILASANASRTVGAGDQNTWPFLAWLDGSEVYQQVATALSADPLNSPMLLNVLPHIMAGLCAAQLGDSEASVHGRRLAASDSIEALTSSIELGGLCNSVAKDAELMSLLQSVLDLGWDEMSLQCQFAQQLKYYNIRADQRQRRLLIGIVEKL
jgi:hypothetical protein